MNKKARWYTPFIHKVLLAAAVAAVLGGCGKKNDAGQETEAPEPSSISIELETGKNPEPVKIRFWMRIPFRSISETAWSIPL